jgi:LysM repeat protein
MSAVEGLPVPIPSSQSADRHPSVDALPALCPYLATPDGGWRSATAIRDHRCTAVAPPIQLALEKQRRLCLVAAHTGCATYVAAEAARPSVRAATARPIARMTPVILDHGRFDFRLPSMRADRASGQAVLVGVLAIALTAILIARPSGDAGAAGNPGSPSPEVTEPAPASAAAGSSTEAVPTTEPTEAVPTEGPALTPGASADSSPAATSVASADPSTSGATYKVRSGDTLSAIAARFGTTVRALVDLNGITDPSRLRVGQVLKLP